jgi:hypothetical protein
MLCYECSKVGRSQDAVGLCHHCSAALCREHSRIVADPVTTTYPIAKAVVLPLQARLFLCETCLAALEQTHPDTREQERSDAPGAATAA